MGKGLNGEQNYNAAPKENLQVINGIDVSHYEPTVDWNKVKSAEYRFGIAKATDGTTGIDSLFASHNSGAAGVGLVTGAYHFLRFNSSPIEQADHFLSVVKGMKGPRLPYIVDVEWSKSEAVSSVNGHEEHVLAFLGRIEQQANEVPMIYTAVGFFGDAQHPERFAKYPLWVANYHTATPLIPKPWTDWKLWQFSEDEDVPGVGKCDVNQADEATFNTLVRQ